MGKRSMERKDVTRVEQKTYVTTPRLVLGCGAFAQADRKALRLQPAYALLQFLCVSGTGRRQKPDRIAPP